MPSVASPFRLLVGLLLAGVLACAHAAPLPEAFTAALKQAGIPLSHVAVVVQPLDAAEPILDHNADAAFNPASVMKLVTSFAALDRLGPAFVWKTRVWADGPITDGVLDGDLIVQGRGDPTLTLERVWLLQRELRARGIRHIRGRLVLDTTYFDLPAADPGEFDNEPFALYNAPPGALVANFNAIALRVRPSADKIAVTPEIALPGVAVISRIEPIDGEACNDWRRALTPTFEDDARSRLVISGQYARACGERLWPLNLQSPAATFDSTFRALWGDSGGTLAGPTVAGVAPTSEPVLDFASEPLPAALVRLNKFSNNLMARNLFLTLGAEAYGAPATLDKGRHAVRDVLELRGMSTRKLVLDNGAGLSRIERVSARALNELLNAAYASPLFAEFIASLPLTATDGTLKRRFNGSSLAGQAHLKTGTLRDVRALAGYVDAADGRRMSFVMLVNHANARDSEPAQRVLLEWLQTVGENTR